jgi:hypothetical protein
MQRGRRVVESPTQDRCYIGGRWHTPKPSAEKPDPDRAVKPGPLAEPSDRHDRAPQQGYRRAP